jgi:hypothetical protein
LLSKKRKRSKVKKEIEEHTNEMENNDNNKVMAALWNGAGLQSAFRHDAIDGSNKKNKTSSTDREARKFSKRAEAALRAEQEHLWSVAPVHEPTWTGRRGSSGLNISSNTSSSSSSSSSSSPATDSTSMENNNISYSSSSPSEPRFGNRTNHMFGGNTSSSGVESADLSARLLMSQTSGSLSSSSLLEDIRQRNVPMENINIQRRPRSTTPTLQVHSSGRISNTLRSSSSNTASNIISSNKSSSSIRSRDSLGSALERREKGPVVVKKILKRQLTQLFQHYDYVLTTDQVLEILPSNGTLHSVNETEQRKIFKRELKLMASNRGGVWYYNNN